MCSGEMYDITTFFLNLFAFGRKNGKIKDEGNHHHGYISCSQKVDD